MNIEILDFSLKVIILVIQNCLEELSGRTFIYFTNIFALFFLKYSFYYYYYFITNHATKLI